MKIWEYSFSRYTAMKSDFLAELDFVLKWYLPIMFSLISIFTAFNVNISLRLYFCSYVRGKETYSNPISETSIIIDSDQREVRNNVDQFPYIFVRFGFPWIWLTLDFFFLINYFANRSFSVGLPVEYTNSISRLFYN